MSPCPTIFLFAVVLLAAFTVTTMAQVAKKPAPKPAVSKTEKEEEPNPLAAQRKTVAIALLMSLADDARSYHDQTLRARVLARAADALWDSEVEKARALFRRAWEAATAADKEAFALYEAERQRQNNSRTQTYIKSPPELRAEVLRLSSKRDPNLSEEFLASLDEEAKPDLKPGNSFQPGTEDPENPPFEVANRLQLARHLLESGDTARALLFADRVLDRVTTRGIFFLCALREKDEAAADQRFARMLAAAVANPSSDATSVSVLSSYVFTPFLYIIVKEKGRHSSQERDQIVAPNISPALRVHFLKGAASILLRPIPPPDQDRTLGGKRGLYFTIARLLPLYEQYAPELAPELRVQLASLGADVPEDLRTGRDALLTRGLVPTDQVRDEGQEALEAADRVSDPAQRDSLYVRAAMTAARKGDVNARNLVDKIGASELRKNARAYVDFTLVGRALDAKDVAETLRLLTSSELTHLQRTWALQEAAKLMKKSDPTRASEVLEEAATSARRIGGSDADRGRALVGVATQMFDIDHARVWEALLEAIKAANSAADFSGEDAILVARFQSGNGTSTSSMSVNTFDLPGIFTSLAREDLFRSIEMAKTFTADAPKATATIAIARAVLTSKPAGSQ